MLLKLTFVNANELKHATVVVAVLLKQLKQTMGKEKTKQTEDPIDLLPLP